MSVKIPELRGDFSLNAANAVATGYLLRSGGLTRLTPTHDLNAKQIVSMARLLGPEVSEKLEVIVHQHMPIFHTEHCVFCRFLSDGNSYKDCGHPCEKNSVSLRGFDGQDHLVLADMVRTDILTYCN
jgi:collagenase-like PrtC family protease